MQFFGNSSDKLLTQDKDYSKFIFCGLFAAVSILIFFPEVVPFWDYPPHLARMHILKLNGADPIISEHFTINWHYVPNLALDLFAYPLLQFLSPDLVMRIFICCGMLIGASGTIYLHRTMGGKGYWPYIVFLFLINDILAFGFLSYVFSNGITVWFFAFWLKAREMKTIPKLSIFTALTFFLLTCHLFAFCVYAMLVGSHEIAKLIERFQNKGPFFTRNLIIGALQFLPSFAVFILASQTSENATVEPGTIMAKLSGIASIISLYHIETQLVAISLICLFVIVFLVKKKAKLAPYMYVFLILSIAIFLVAPDNAFGSFFLDRRMPIAFLFPFIASIQFKDFELRPALRQVILVTSCLFQYLLVGYNWQNFDRSYEDMFIATSELKSGDKLLHFNMESLQFSDNLAPPYIRFPEYLLVTKNVISPFVFADVRHQPIIYNGPYAIEEGEYPSIPLEDLKRHKKLKKALDGHLSEEFDYLLLTDFDNDFLDNSAKWHLHKKQGIFSLYKKIK